MKTHKVLDLLYTVDEEQECFSGTEKECWTFIKQQGSATFMFKVIPMTKDEIEIYNDNQSS